MRTATAELQAFLLSKAPFWTADLYSVACSNGQTLYMTTADRDLVFGGVTYKSTTPAIKRGTWSVKNTQEVPSLSFDLYSTGTDYTDVHGNVVNFKELAHQGFLDYALIQMSRAFMPTFGDTTLGAVLLFGGRTAGIQITALGVKVTAKGDNVLMQQYMPRNMYQLGCIHMLYDAGCTLAKSAFTLTQGMGSGAANTIFVPWGAAPATPSNYVLGSIEVLTGLGEGQTRTIIAANSLGVTLSYPLYTVPATGDTISFVQGCQKTLANCTSQFGNEAHFRGFPYIPPVETAY